MKFQLLDCLVVFLQRFQVPISNTSQDLFELSIMIEFIWHLGKLSYMENSPSNKSTSEIKLKVAPGTQETFTLFLPIVCLSGLMVGSWLRTVAFNKLLSYSPHAGHIYDKSWSWPENLSFSHKLRRGQDRQDRRETTPWFRWCHCLITWQLEIF